MQPATVTLLLAACFMTATVAQDCSSRYEIHKYPPLLFGGVSDASRCKSNCHSRDTQWGRTCAFNSDSGWGTCSPEQARRSLELGLTLGGGEVKNLTPCDLVKYLRGRTLWLLGDSHAKSFYKALQCFLIDFQPAQECETSPNAQAVQQLYNLPVAPGQSKCFHLLGDVGGRVCMVHVVLGTSLVNNPKITMGGVLPLLRSKFANKQDIFYINFGVWHKKKPEWYKTFQPALEALGRYYQSSKSEWPHMLFRELPADHPKDTGAKSCKPLQGYDYNSQTGKVTINPAARINNKMSSYSLNNQARQILAKYHMPVLSAFAISVPLYDNHIGKVLSPQLDCLHYCHPGVPEMWIWYLYEAMREGQSGIRAIDAGGRSKEITRIPSYKCVPSSTMF